MTKSHLFFLIFLLMVNMTSQAKNIVTSPSTEPSQESSNPIEIDDVTIISTQLIIDNQFQRLCKKWGFVTC
ncbi:hypothetical protein GWK90_06155 [Candidatus Hamiltonella defensa]|uniref:Uncharacterized protein n=1 Tax=Candidatus Williamhamiltonella defendens TaxID=138072 RepID=A0AAC9VHU2_9ENTR|nr:hypothetical protein [Candidatus Hamiltonella defensa]ASV33278.1 hypothetical protein CJJ18_03430 [Candidatus Hamiltonella defensa]AWK16243.1 hypothetical protein CCS40_03450 [Candidatus Hamiltonella defensa]MBK4361843.1 hypothetical protein [Candidatus Hamiltonella defensa]